MIIGINYYKPNGKIFQIVKYDGEEKPKDYDNIGFIQVDELLDDYSNHYVLNGKIVEKKTFKIKQLKRQPYKFTNIPIGTVAIIQTPNQPTFQIDDGEIEFDMNIGGFYEVLFTHAQFKDLRMSFTL